MPETISRNEFILRREEAPIAEVDTVVPAVLEAEYGAVDWQAINRERVELIKKQTSKGLTEEEAQRLYSLQTKMREKVNQVFPFPAT